MNRAIIELCGALLVLSESRNKISMRIEIESAASINSVRACVRLWAQTKRKTKFRAHEEPLASSVLVTFQLYWVLTQRLSLSHSFCSLARACAIYLAACILLYLHKNTSLAK